MHSHSPCIMRTLFYSHPMQEYAHLPRLAPEFYRGFAMVHWTLTVKERQNGWLDQIFHARFREVLLHACAKHDLFCPVYCLMPDHVHLIWMGVDEFADQRNAMKFFKAHINRLLAPQALQKQSYDNVLREKDRERNAFQATCFYILANPVRAGLTGKANDWPHFGAMVPGYPDLSPHEAEFWELFWRFYASSRGKATA